MARKFNRGDRIKCIIAEQREGLVDGAVYEVVSCEDGYNPLVRIKLKINNKEMVRDFFVKRFVLVIEPAKEKIDYLTITAEIAGKK